MKSRQLSILSISIMLIASACGSDKKADDKGIKPQTVEFESYSFTKISEAVNADSVLTELPGSNLCRNTGQGVLPTRIGDFDIKPLRDSLISLAQVEFPSSGVAAPMMEKGWRITDRNDSTESCNERINILSVVLQNPYIIVWQDYAGEYICGAAHGMYANRYVNYSLKTNRMLKLADLFKPKYEKELTALIRAKLEGNSDIMAEPSQIGIPAQFRITPDGITFIYGIYEISPYSAGEIEVSFYLYELEDLLSADGMRLVNYFPAD